MARPSAASLNSLASALRKAQPIYSECRSILNYLDANDPEAVLPPPEDTTNDPGLIPTNKSADCISHSVFERRTQYRKGIV
jgi:hypothetical protein